MYVISASFRSSTALKPRRGPVRSDINALCAITTTTTTTTLVGVTICVILPLSTLICTVFRTLELDKHRVFVG
jgi:hypothetical protein